jgi:hypothetical protein
MHKIRSTPAFVIETILFVLLPALRKLVFFTTEISFEKSPKSLFFSEIC